MEFGPSTVFSGQNDRNSKTFIAVNRLVASCNTKWERSLCALGECVRIIANSMAPHIAVPLGLHRERPIVDAVAPPFIRHLLKQHLRSFHSLFSLHSVDYFDLLVPRLGFTSLIVSVRNPSQSWLRSLALYFNCVLTRHQENHCARQVVIWFVVSLESVFSRTLSTPIVNHIDLFSLLTDSLTWSGVSLSSRTAQSSFHLVMSDRDDDYVVKLDEVVIGLSWHSESWNEWSISNEKLKPS